tara:strand:- start:5092 stop:6339 length:1248 start_codon:yes stop_codon:yes gene_type:complete
MSFFKILNKLLISILYISFFLFIIYTIYLINSKEPRNKDTRRILKSVFTKGTISQHIFNDYREEFLPSTQFINLNFEKIDLNFLKLNSCYFGECYTFFLEQYQDNLIITDRYGVFRYAKFEEIKESIKNLNIIKTNLNFDTILDTFIVDDTIYVSGKKIINDTDTELHVAKASFNYSELNFQNIVELKSKQCFFRHAVHSGKIQSNKDNKNQIILSVNSSADNEGLENLSSDSVCGKILLIDVESGEYEIFTSGHRNIIGMYSDENVILATEHGPFAGDEINNIQQGLSYGWPVSSYGEKYSRGQSNEPPNYKKSHEAHGFQEPIFSFIPAIGISEIIRLPNKFSEMWQNNFLVASLNGKYLYRIKFDKDYKKIIYHEKIFIGDRIRDIIYNDSSNEIYLSLELDGELGIISKAR